MTTLYVSSDRPVDSLTIAISRAIDNVARDLELPYFLAGAMARDIVLTNIYGIRTGLATTDVDFAIAVAHWDQFELLKTKLVDTGRFESSDKVAHRIYYSDHGGRAAYPVDVIPFGGVENPANSIAWPLDKGVIMNVVGYAEILQAVLSVEIETGFAVPIARFKGAEDSIAMAEGILEQFRAGLTQEEV